MYSPTLLLFRIFPAGQEIIWPHSNYYYIQCFQRKLPLVLPTHLWHRLKPEQLFSISEHNKRMNWLKTHVFLLLKTSKVTEAGHCIIPCTQNPRASRAKAIPMRNCSSEEMRARKNSSTKLYPPLAHG